MSLTCISKVHRGVSTEAVKRFTCCIFSDNGKLIANCHRPINFSSPELWNVNCNNKIFSHTQFYSQKACIISQLFQNTNWLKLTKKNTGHEEKMLIIPSKIGLFVMRILHGLCKSSLTLLELAKLCVLPNFLPPTDQIFKTGKSIRFVASPDLAARHTLQK